MESWIFCEHVQMILIDQAMDWMRMEWNSIVVRWAKMSLTVPSRSGGVSECYPPPKNGTWKMVVYNKKNHPFFRRWFSGSMLNFGGVMNVFFSHQLCNGDFGGLWWEGWEVLVLECWNWSLQLNVLRVKLLCLNVVNMKYSSRMKHLL